MDAGDGKLKARAEKGFSTGLFASTIEASPVLEGYDIRYWIGNIADGGRGTGKPQLVASGAESTTSEGRKRAGNDRSTEELCTSVRLRKNALSRAISQRWKMRRCRTVASHFFQQRRGRAGRRRVRNLFPVFASLLIAL